MFNGLIIASRIASLGIVQENEIFISYNYIQISFVK